MEAHEILVIDANDWDREQIQQCLRELSHPVRILRVSDVDAGARPDLIVLGFSDAISLETSRSQLEKVRSLAPRAQLIVCAPRGDDELDSRIIGLKARAFVLKPVNPETLGTLIDESLGQIKLRRERADYARRSKRSSRVTEIIGKSEAIRSVLGTLERVATSSTTTVLLLGESGVGKSLFAHMIHELCSEHSGPFIEINCSTLPSQLLESELFGYEPGAFTDARSQKIGLIELAHGGTLFLDEISEVELVTQAKLLKFLDAKRFRRLGGDHEISVDVRVVAATNRDLRSEMRAGAFREDLFYRLNVVEVFIPPLRERPEDIDEITNYYLDFFKKKFNRSHLDISPAARALIRKYPWPGNVRELVNALERAALLCKGDMIEPELLPLEIPKNGRRALRVRRDEGELEVSLPEGGVELASVERVVIEETLRRTRGNVSSAAEMLGLSRGALRNKIVRHQIDPHRFARRAPVGA
ncbi:MAG: sigma-54-dependent Fis family transcriptional regulator [Candidatus Krumholzibacteriota bacterium]|nr:sigma-54-dependent Fis family transcriptional regulator [Candidatus Krumholzibacteriota bacterium]